jgi:hypothetical protein
VPATLVLVTPELSAQELKTFDKDNGYGLAHALWANDPINREHISLNNILQVRFVHPDGSEEMLPFEGTLQEVKPKVGGSGGGTFRYPVDNITDPKLKELWWEVERGYPGALKILVQVAARKTAPGPDAARILEQVKAASDKRQEELLAAPANVTTYEALEAYITESEGLDVKKAQARMKEIKATKELKDEFKARDIYIQCEALIASDKADKQKTGKDGLALLAKKMPDTVYGKKAAESH